MASIIIDGTGTTRRVKLFHRFEICSTAEGTTRAASSILERMLRRTATDWTARCFSTTRCVAGKASQTAIRKKKRNVERQRVLGEERSPSNFDAIAGVETDFTRALLTPARVLSAARGAARDSTALAANDSAGGVEGQEGGGYGVTIADASLDFDTREVSKIQSAAHEALQARLQKTGSNDTSARLRPPQAPAGGSGADKADDPSAGLTGLARDLNDLQLSESSKAIASSRIVSLLNANSRTLQAYNTSFAQRSFARSEGDTGSAEVQAAILTTRILALKQHFASQGAAKKDKHSWRGYRQLVHKRQKLLKYLRTESTSRYFDCLGRLGLTDASVMREISM